ncbi:hypothetical protein KCG48_07800 [Proteiniclasticum sp. BAD-10]|uniref:Uncharacterized protein n=1 Tax=Proteiniclasticum sediminis TaxID=2804028 RepID=A0A941CRX3_9CLOT|nr:hypothetical protein [Proteiniclasticum sediminis]MBR0576246.1 hypothetical protein [Proteiniclasticum sediminis]
MILNRLDNQIKAMKSLRRHEAIKINQNQQTSTDTKYKSLVEQVKSFIEAVKFVQDNLSFSMSDTLQADLKSIVVNLQNVYSTGFANKDELTKIDTDFKSIQTTIKTSWIKHFSAYTNTTTNTLRVISGINSEKVTRCLNDIKVAENWTLDTRLFSSLKNAMTNAELLIQSLNMDQETILFLTKMTSGQATIADLNENVLSWIRKESLEGKIKLSFFSR